MLTVSVSVILKIITIIKSCSHQDGRFSSDSDVMLLGGRRGHRGICLGKCGIRACSVSIQLV